MRIVLLSSEVVPFAKTGGLADVTGALPRFLSQLGLEVKLIMPFYREVKKKGFPVKKVIENKEMDWAGTGDTFSVWELEGDDFPVFFIEKDTYFDRDFLYGTEKGDYPDNGERFAFFPKASLETLKHLDFRPHILHCHDWQSAMALAYLKWIYGEDSFFEETRSLFTIHNLAYQGLFEREILGKVGLPDHLFRMEALEFYGKVNFLKAGILYSTAVSTVSRRYSREIQTPEFGCGMDGLLRTRKDSLFGILNGVDYSEWNPATDKHLAANYGPESMKGKKDCRDDLLQNFGLPLTGKDIPVAGMVTRLAGQKGIDILCEALDGIFRMGICLVILGTGEEKFQNILLEVQKKNPGALSLKIAFDEALAHKITAGSDMFLIPSRYEPCGLTQMYSLKYGTIPVVRATGGLDDSIKEFNAEKLTGNGFKFEEYTPEALGSALKRAVSVFKKKTEWKALLRTALSSDFSWEKSAGEYAELYKKISRM